MSCRPCHLYWLLLILLPTLGFAQTHFVPVPDTGAPYAIAVQSAQLEGEGLVAGDEVAVFDSDLCVGAEVVSGEWPLILTAWEGIPSENVDGFTAGNPMTFRIWEASSDLETNATAEYEMGDGTFGYDPGSVVMLFASVPAPDLQYSQTSHDFGQVFVGEEAAWQLTLENVGTLPLNVTSATTTSDPFSVLLEGALMIPAGGSATLPVEFAPTSSGVSTAEIIIASDDPAPPSENVSLSGEGVVFDPEMVLQPTVIDAGVQNIGEPYETALTITNGGNALLEVDLAASDGELITLGEGGATASLEVEPGDEVLLPVTVTAQQVGDQSGEILVTSNDEDNASVNVPVSITGGEPDIHLPQSAVAFGPVPVGQSVELSLTVENLGNVDLEIEDLLLGGEHAEELELGEDGLQIGDSVQPGGSGDIHLWVTPAGAGDGAATLTISSNDPDTPSVTIPITFTGTAGDILFPVSAVDFGTVPYDYPSEVEFRVQNGGNAELEISDIEVELPFTVADAAFPILLPPGTGEEDGIIVLYAWDLDQPGEYSGESTFHSDDPDEPAAVIPVSGTVDEPPLVTPHQGTVDPIYAPVSGGSSGQAGIAVAQGRAVVTDVSASGVGFSLEELPLPQHVQAEAGWLFDYQFNPPAVGEYAGQITITTNDPLTPVLQLEITGYGYQQGPDLQVSDLALNFGYVVLGESTTLDLLLENSGDVPLIVQGLVLAPATADFSQEASLPLILPAGGSEAVGITFTPELAGQQSAALTLHSTDFDQPEIVVSLTGVGAASGPEIAAPASVDWGSVTVGAPFSRTLPVDNEGQAPLQITQVAVEVEFFGFVGDLPVTLPPDASHELTFSGVLEEEGPHTTTVEISSNDGDENPLPVEVFIEGTAVPTGDIHIPEGSQELAFGQRLVGETHSLGFSVENLGSAELTITGITSTEAAFSSSPTGFPIGLEPSGVLEGQALFTPSEDEEYSGQLVIASDDPDEPEAFIDVSGQGVEELDLAHFDPVDPTGSPYAIAIQEARINGTVIAEGDEIGVFDGDLCAGAVAATGTWPVTITAWEGIPGQEVPGFTAGNEMSFRLWRAADDQEGPADAQYNTGDGTFGFGFGSDVDLLQAAFAEGDIHLPSDAHDYGGVLVGQGATWALTIQNQGGAPLTITAIVEDPPFHYVGDMPWTIPAFGQISADLVFLPQSGGEFTGLVEIVSTDPDEGVVTVTLTGNGLQPNPPEEFALLAPEDEAVLEQLSVTFQWEPTTDPDPGDEVSYTLLLATNEGMNDPVEHDAGAESELTLELTDDTSYWWRVHARDTNTEGTFSDIWSLHVAVPEPPGPFSLLLPEDGASFAPDQAEAVTFSWTASEDPDPDETPAYMATFEATVGAARSDTLVTIEELQGTEHELNLVQLLSLGDDLPWDEDVQVDWWVQAVSGGDTTDSDETWNLTIAANTAVEEWHLSGLPERFELTRIYPNPFNPSTTVVVGLPRASELRLEVFNLMGRRVALLHAGPVSEGYHRFAFDGSGLGSGLYFVRAHVPGELDAMRKLLLVR